MISLPKTWKGQSARIADNLYSSKEAQAFRLLKEANFWFARSAAMRRANGPHALEWGSFARRTPTSMELATSRPAAKVTIVSSMQWLYGPTWGATLVRCDRQSVEHQKAKKLCISAAQMRARQLELAEVVRRNLEHPAVSAYHLLVNDASEVQEFFRKLPHRAAASSWGSWGGRAGSSLLTWDTRSPHLRRTSVTSAPRFPIRRS